MLPKIFGAKATGARLQRIHSSPNFKDGAFQNPEPTSFALQGASMFKVIREMLNKPKLARPPGPIAALKPDLRALTAARGAADGGATGSGTPATRGAGEQPQFVWFGHSAYLIRSAVATILVDPVFSGNAAPFKFFAKAFPGTDLYKPDDFDSIDVLLLTHDHYDHLDYKTVVALAPRVKAIVTSLGVGAHLEYWGIPSAKITELDLGASASPLEAVRLTSTPARHFSGRTFKRNQTLWASFVLQLGSHKLFLGGDSGYGAHFAEIGRTYGPFDLAILECGQYGPYWPQIHMFPEQTLQAARDLGAAVLLPVHWGKFDLSLHEWDEPIKRLTKAYSATGAPPLLVTPRIGEVFSLGGPYPTDPWWEH